MGGFTLRGPRHTIRSTAPYKCRCMGYIGTISGELEESLMRKEEKILILEELPEELRTEMKMSHLSEDMRYEVIENKKPMTYPRYEYNPNIY